MEVRYLLDVNSRVIHKVDFMQDGEFLKQIRKLSDSIIIFNDIHVNTKKARLNKNIKDNHQHESEDHICTNQKVLELIMYSDFEIFEEEKEAKKRLNEFRSKKNE